MKKISFGVVVTFLIFIFVGLVFGLMTIRLFEYYSLDGSFGFILFYSCSVLLLLLLGFLQIVIHELGHLVMGLLSGYGFLSFRVASLCFLKVDGKLVLKRQKLEGTGGQCLMSPPAYTDARFPSTPYLLGGSLLNFLTSAFALMICLISDNALVQYIFSVFASVGLAFALQNGVPLDMGSIVNDGMNVLLCSRHDEAKFAIYAQLRMAELMHKGIRLRDMPEELFACSDERLRDNVLCSSMAVYGASRYIDMLDLEGARTHIERLLRGPYRFVGILRFMLKVEMIFLDLLQGKDSGELSVYEDKEFSKLEKAMGAYPSVLRLGYTRALLRHSDEEAAEVKMSAFEKMAKTYPFPIEVESERELIHLVRVEYDKRKQCVQKEV